MNLMRDELIQHIVTKRGPHGGRHARTSFKDLGVTPWLLTAPCALKPRGLMKIIYFTSHNNEAGEVLEIAE